MTLVRLRGARIMGFAKARETAGKFCDVLLNLQVELFWLHCLTVLHFVPNIHRYAKDFVSAVFP